MTSAAVAVASWGRSKWRHGGFLPANIPGPMNPAGNDPDGGTGDLIGTKVELLLGALGWTDITSYVRLADMVHITRGRPDETSQVQPQTCTFTIDNRDGRFTPRNPVGAWYGLIGRNTPVRVSRLANGVRRYRFYGEVPAWPTTYDQSGTDVYTQISAAGVLRRLNQGAQPLRSPMFRVYTYGYASYNAFGPISFSVQAPVAYWPCEDGQNSTSIAPGPLVGSAMTLSGSPTFASNSSFPGSAALPLLSTSVWTGVVPSYSGGSSNVLRFLMFVPSTGAFDTGTVARLYTQGTVAWVDVQYGVASSGSLNLTGYNAAGSQLFTTGYVSGPFNGKAVQVSVELTQSGSAVAYALAYMTATTGSSTLGSGTVAASTIGNATQVVINLGGHINDTAVGHVAVQAAFEPQTNVALPFVAWAGDSAVLRLTRLCAEQGVVGLSTAGTDGTFPFGLTFPLLGTSDPGDVAQLGYQPIDTLPNLLQQCADTPGDLLFESREQLALMLRFRLSLYNRPAHLTLDHSLNQLSGPLAPVDDDALTRNDVTVTRIGGSSATQILTSGTLSTQAPPNGVGDYQTSYSISLFADSLLLDQAGWRLHMGTVDQPRYPQISINLRHSTFTGSVAMMNAALTIEIGDRLVVANPPPQVAADPISQVVQGYSEVLGNYQHDMTFNCSPESPYEIAILEDAVLGRLDTDGSTLAATYPLGTETALLVATTNASSPLWTTTDFPFDIAVGGERMTVTNVTGATSPQTFTVTRSVNGVVKTQTSGTDVRLWQPMILSL